jgi:TPR repeat protein
LLCLLILNEAQLALAWLYKIVMKKEQEAARWYHAAAEQNHAEALFHFGVCNIDGIGVQKNEAEAVRLFRLAAEQNHVLAIHNLGVLYEGGVGTKKNEIEAVRWFRAAAVLNHPGSQFNLGVSYENGSGVEQNNKEAVRWFRLAAASGDAESLYALGDCYARGVGVEADLVMAALFYQSAGHLKAPLEQMRLNLSLVCSFSHSFLISQDEQTIHETVWNLNSDVNDETRVIAIEWLLTHQSEVEMMVWR